MKAWILFLLGTLAYFFLRFQNRKDRTTKPDFLFWIKDNIVQLAPAVILDVMLMIMFMDADTDITKWLSGFLPAGIVVSAKLAGSALCGLGLGWGFYEALKKKAKEPAQ